MPLAVAAHATVRRSCHCLCHCCQRCQCVRYDPWYLPWLLGVPPEMSRLVSGQMPLFVRDIVADATVRQRCHWECHSSCCLANLSLHVPLPVTNVGQITWNTNYWLLLLAKSKRSKQETAHKKLQNEIVLPGRSCFFFLLVWSAATFRTNSGICPDMGHDMSDGTPRSHGSTSHR